MPPSDALAIAVTTGLGVSVIAGILSGICYILNHSVPQKRKKRPCAPWYCNVCQAQFRSIQGVLEVEKVVTCAKCNEKVCRLKCSIRVPGKGWICQNCQQPENWFKGLLKAIQPSNTQGWFGSSKMDDSGSIDELDEDLMELRKKEREQVRDFIERLVESMLGGNLDDVSVGKIYNDKKYDALFARYHADLSNALTDLGSALHISISNLPISGQSPCTAHASLKLLIQRFIKEAIELPELKKQLGHPMIPEEQQEDRTYEDLLSTAIINKVVQNYQNERGPSSSANSVCSRASSTTKKFDNNNKEYFFSEETLDTKWRTKNDVPDETSSTSSLDDWIKSDSSAGSSKFIDRVSLTIKQQIEEVTSSEEEGSRKSLRSQRSSQLKTEEPWGDNWYLQKRIAGTHSPIPVPMLVPNPTVEAKVLIGDKDAEDTSDLSDNCSDFGDTEVVPDIKNILVNSRTIIGGKNLLESAIAAEDETILGEVRKEEEQQLLISSDEKPILSEVKREEKLEIDINKILSDAMKEEVRKKKEETEEGGNELELVGSEKIKDKMNLHEARNEEKFQIDARSILGNDKMGDQPVVCEVTRKETLRIGSKKILSKKKKKSSSSEETESSGNESLEEMEYTEHFEDEKPIFEVSRKEKLVIGSKVVSSDEEKEEKRKKKKRSSTEQTQSFENNEIENDALLSLDSNTEQDAEYTEQYGSLLSTILKSPKPTPRTSKSNDVLSNQQSDVVDGRLGPNGAFDGNVSSDSSEDNDEEKLQSFKGSYSEREKEKWKHAVELLDNPYAPEKLESRLSNRSDDSLTNLFGRDYYIKEASKSTGARKKLSSSDFEPADYEEKTEALLVKAIPVFVRSEDDEVDSNKKLTSSEKDAVRPSKEMPATNWNNYPSFTTYSEDSSLEMRPNHLLEISSDSDLSIERVYNLESGRIIQKVGQISHEIVFNSRSPEGINYTPKEFDEDSRFIKKKIVDENHNDTTTSGKMQAKKREFLRSLTQDDNEQQTDSAAKIDQQILPNENVEEVFEEVPYTQVKLKDKETVGEVIKIDDVSLIPKSFGEMKKLVDNRKTSDYSEEEEVQDFSLEYSTTDVGDQETASPFDSLTEIDPEIIDLKEKKLVKDVLGRFSKSFPNLSSIPSKKIEERVNYTALEVEESEERSASMECVDVDMPSVRNLKKLFDKDIIPKNQQQVHSLTARSISKQFRQELRSSDEKSFEIEESAVNGLHLEQDADDGGKLPMDITKSMIAFFEQLKKN